MEKTDWLVHLKFECLYEAMKIKTGHSDDMAAIILRTNVLIFS